MSGRRSAAQVREPEGYRAFIEALNQATGRSFKGDDGSRERYAARRKQGYSEDDLLAAGRGAGISPFHRGENDKGMPYQDPITILRSKVLDTLIALGKGEIRPGGNGAVPAAIAQSRRFEAMADEMEGRQ